MVEVTSRRAYGLALSSPLAVATFAVGTHAFIMSGLLPAVGADLEVEAAEARQLVTVFALTLAVSAPC